METGQPLAMVQGQAYLELPKDLYIPPDALEVFLEAFSGPLDLLLYLIKKQNLDILNIPIAEITRQYMEYVELMKELNLELAAEYLVMAAMLAEIKSRMLLPRPAQAAEDEQDPRADLIRRLQEYERFKKAAEEIDNLPRVSRELYVVSVEVPRKNLAIPLPQCQLQDVLVAFKKVLDRAKLYTHHQVKLEALSVRERMSNILAVLGRENFTEFSTLFTVAEGRMGVVVTFLALLELVKASLIELVQNEPFGPIYIKSAA